MFFSQRQTATRFLAGMLLMGVVCVLCQPSVATAAETMMQVAQAPATDSADGEDGKAQPNQAREKATGFLDTIASIWNGTVNWIKAKIKIVTDKVDSVFGFEKGEGPLALFGTAFYIFIGIILLFFLVFFFNIVKDMFASMFGGGGRKKPPRRR